VSLNATGAFSEPPGPPMGNIIRGNSIHDNHGLGIDLSGGSEDASGVTTNDPLDTDSGPNGLQNSPVLTNAYSGASSAVIGSLHSTPNTTFFLDFYANATADPAGHGEGQRWLGSTAVCTDASGNATLGVAGLLASVPGEWISTTATGPDGTSEF